MIQFTIINPQSFTLRIIKDAPDQIVMRNIFIVIISQVQITDLRIFRNARLSLYKTGERKASNL